VSGYERLVRGRVSAARERAGTNAWAARFEATAQAIAAGATEDELIERGALTMRAHEIRQQVARELAVEQATAKRAAVVAYGQRKGLADEHGDVSRLDVKRALRRDEQRLADVPAPAREGPSERRGHVGVSWPEPNTKTDPGRRP
jgi:hypothetical protein